MFHIIESVVSRNPEKKNKWHSELIGKRCFVEQMWKDRPAILIVENLVEWEEFSRYRTSIVLDTHAEKIGDVARLIVRTVNSVYTLRRMDNAQESNP